MGVECTNFPAIPELEELYERVVDFQGIYIAKRIHRLYQYFRRQVEDGYQCPGEFRNDEFWLRVVRDVARQHASPIEFVVWAVTVHEVPPWPTSLCSRRLLAAYTETIISDSYGLAEQIVKVQLDRLISSIDGARGPTREMLIDERNPVKPLLTWCGAVQEGFADIEEEYRPRAIDEFLNPCARRAFRGFQPELEQLAVLNA